MPPAKTPPKVEKPFTDFSFLPPDEQSAIRDEAKKIVAKEAVTAASKAFLEQEIERARKDAGLKDKDEEEIAVTIDLPGFAQSIVINGTHYMHGHSYNVPRSRYIDIQAQMQKSWEHEDEIGGANRDHYRKPQFKKVRMGAGGSAMVS